jgi:SAM-dependent methyltransferase
MSKEAFKPLPVKSPDDNPYYFKLRCFIDLQLLTIANFLRHEMLNFRSGAVIDVGAGESPWKKWLPKRCTYQGIDIRYAKEFGMSNRNHDVTLYDGGKMPFENNSFDGSLCVEVLEHAQDPDTLLSEIFRIMKPGSMILLTVPWSARRHHIPFDFHRFTKERLATLLNKNGFVDVSIVERGNDYCVVSNKLIINILRNMQSTSISNFFYIIPYVGIASIFAIFILIVAHITLWVGNSRDEDPLGYSCKAFKP